MCNGNCRCSGCGIAQQREKINELIGRMSGNMPHNEFEQLRMDVRVEIERLERMIREKEGR